MGNSWLRGRRAKRRLCPRLRGARPAFQPLDDRFPGDRTPGMGAFTRRIASASHGTMATSLVTARVELRCFACTPSPRARHLGIDHLAGVAQRQEHSVVSREGAGSSPVVRAAW